jgi:hypothetical protein
MPIDAYSLCPGGTGKKIKFCCGEFLSELQKIDRMVEGEQFLACLKHIDHLLAEGPDHNRPCLLATKCMLLRATGQDEAARTTAATFLEKHPDNQIALAESALLVIESDARAALDLVRRAIRVADGNLMGRTYQAMGMTAASLLHEGLPQPARALLQLQFSLVEDDPRPGEVLSAMSAAGDIPLLLRDDAPPMVPPENAPWKDRFIEALHAVAMGDWQTGAERLTALAGDVSDAPVVWRTLATLRGWMADNAGAADALRRYAVLRAVEANGQDDAVEAEAEALFLSADPLGDRIDMFKVAWTVKNVDLAQEAFLSSSRFISVPFDPAQFSDGETPPPKTAYMLLDRPMPESAEGFSIESAPRLLGQALLFGRQTDREARFEVLGVAADEMQAVRQMVTETAGDAVDPEPKNEVVGQWSGSQKLMRAAFQPPRGVSPDQLRALVGQYQRDAILKHWPNLNLGALDGRSPREAAADPKCRIRLLAAILVLEHWTERVPGSVDMNELRAELGLPVQEPIDPRNMSVQELPTIRLGRLIVENLSDKDLVFAYYRAAAYALRQPLRRFAQAIVDRPSLAESNERMSAYGMLARNEEDVSKALTYIEQGRHAAEARKQSNASWDLMELSLRFGMRDGKAAMQLIEHIQRTHIEEPGVGEALTQMLVDVGLIRPDGTLAVGPHGPGAAMAPEEAAPAGDSGGLWTPDSAAPSGGGGGKLWTPE